MAIRSWLTDVIPIIYRSHYCRTNGKKREDWYLARIAPAQARVLPTGENGRANFFFFCFYLVMGVTCVLFSSSSVVHNILFCLGAVGRCLKTREQFLYLKKRSALKSGINK